jgi:hypothetical protein
LTDGLAKPFLNFHRYAEHMFGYSVESSGRVRFMEKVFLRVDCECTPDGDIQPVRFLWINKRWYDVDLIVDVRRAPSLKVGGKGICYTCRVKDRIIRLFRDGDRWYLEPA